MTLKLVHFSDTHLRTLKFHDEYSRVFDNFYSLLDDLKPDVIVNTGDLVHAKTNLSPELVDMVSEFLKSLAKRAPVHSILGNHDFNLMNLNRRDAISPIVQSINDERIKLHTKSGLSFSLEKDGQKYNFWTFSLADQKNYPTPLSWREYTNDVNIGLLHGAISTSITDLNWEMKSVEYDLGVFDGLDFALLGDIHKQQFFKNNTIAYAGSLVQQNFGEEVDKGFLLWEFGRKKEKHNVKSFVLSGSRNFYTIHVGEDLIVPDLNIITNSRIRVSPARQLTLIEQKDLEKEVKRKFSPHDVIVLSANNISEQKINVDKKIASMENIRSTDVQDKLLREFFEDQNIDESIFDRVLDLNRRLQLTVDQEEFNTRGVNWKIDKIAWNNLLNYGEGNIIDFSRLGGLIGLFAPNGSGKSNFIDIILETCFDETTKGVNKNIFLVNDNKSAAASIMEITANDQRYELTRQIEKIKYGHRKGSAKEWGKTTVDFVSIDETGERQQHVEEHRAGTEKNIRQCFGTYGDFLLTSLCAQWNMQDIINVRETERKKIIYRFLDLEFFSKKDALAKEEYRIKSKQLEDIESVDIEKSISNLESSIAMREDESNECYQNAAKIESDIEDLEKEMLNVAKTKKNVDDVVVKKWEEELACLRDKAKDKSAKIELLKNRLLDIENTLLKLDALEKKFDRKLHEEKNTKYESIVNEIYRAEEIEKSLKKEFFENKKNADLLNEVPCGDSFKGCKFLVNAFKSREKMTTIANDIRLNHSVIENLNGEKELLYKFVLRLKEFIKFIDNKKELESEKSGLLLQIENLSLQANNIEKEIGAVNEARASFEKMESDLRFNAYIESEMLKFQSKKVELTKKLRLVQNKAIEIAKKIGSDQGILKKLQEQYSLINDLKSTCQAYELYHRAMGKDGIPHQILTKKLPFINEEINKILSNVTDFSVFLEHDEEEQSIRFFIQYGDYKSRLLELGGGAEKFIASMAIRSALLNISMLPKSNVFIIDEGFGKLDPKNLENVLRMFDYLKTVFEHVIIVSHLDTMKDVVDNFIEITTDEEGYAHIEIGDEQ